MTKDKKREFVQFKTSQMLPTFSRQMQVTSAVTCRMSPRKESILLWCSDLFSIYATEKVRHRHPAFVHQSRASAPELSQRRGSIGNAGRLAAGRRPTLLMLRLPVLLLLDDPR